MSNKTEFEGIEGFPVIASFFFYEMLFAFSRTLGISWWSINIPIRGRLSPSVAYGFFALSIFIICLIIFLIIAIRRTRKRIKNGETTVKEAIAKYARFFMVYLLWLSLVAIIVPPILRFTYYIF